MPDSSYKHYRLGFFAACSSFIIWGTLPLYWYFLSHVEAGEILSHRIAWSFVFMLFVLIFAGRKQLKEDLAFLREKTSRILLLLTAAVLVTANWLTYIWAVTHGHVIDTSIGYYLNPLLSVLLGVVMFSEKLSTPKRISIVLAAIGGRHRAGTHDLARRALPLAGFTLGRDLRSLRSRQKNAPSTADFEHHTGNTYRLGPVNHIYLQPTLELIRPFFNE